MPSLTKLVGLAVGLASLSSALPSLPRLSTRAVSSYDLRARQLAATGLPAGLTDVDILQLYVHLLFLT